MWFMATRLQYVGLEAWLHAEIQMWYLDPFLSSASSLLALFSKMLSFHGGQIAIAAPSYIFSDSGPILKGVSLSSTL